MRDIKLPPLAGLCATLIGLIAVAMLDSCGAGTPASAAATSVPFPTVTTPTPNFGTSGSSVSPELVECAKQDKNGGSPDN